MKDRIQVLIVEDLPTDAELNKREVIRVLPQSEFRVVETREEFLEALESFRPDLILSDFKLPQFDGIIALQLAKEHAPDIPFIIVTGSMNEDTAVDCMKEGAWDYIIKEHIKRLGPAVLNSLQQKTLRLERKLAEAALQRNETRFRNIAESMSDWIWEIDADGVYTYCSGNFLATLCYQKGEIIGKTPFDFMPADEANRVRAVFNEIFKVKKAFHDLENWNLSKDGRRVCMRTSGVPIFDNAGDFLGYRGVDSDITQRKHAEAEKDRLLTAINQATEIVMITDAKGTILYVNPAFEHVTGYSSEETIGLNPRVLKSGVQDDAFYKKLWDTLLRGETWHGRLVNCKKDGTHYTEEATISPVKDADGKIINYSAVIRDITEELKLEDQYRQSQKMESLGQLVGGVAHDFNNILQIIIGYVGIACMQLEKGHAALRSLAEISTASIRAKDLVQQLLTFSRQQVIDPMDIDLNDEIENTRQMLSRVIGEHIQLNFVPGQDLAPVFADKGQIHQVLMNLCANARDAMPDGGTLTITTKAIFIAPEDMKAHGLAHSGRYILLQVSDTGCGIEKKIRDRIFDPFFTTKEMGKGTGLGLSTVYGIVTQSSGHITVYSEQNHGTVFTIYLPVSHAHAADNIKTTLENTAPYEHGTETLLVAEDDEIILELTTQFLRDAGYTVLTATNGEEAVRVFEDHADEIDCIMMDVVMPHMGGKQALKLILKKCPDVRYVFSSGYNTDTEQNDFVKRKKQHVLNKPYMSEALLRKIREVLDDV
ncbi:MAG: PAS domain S-box protein [Desulfoplanes sp.]|nr:PAS domain S-box protein [Desulfoplanes sp.]